MTREEAIQMINAHKFPTPTEEWQKLNNEAIDIAISALSIPIMEYPQVDGITPHLIDEPNEDLVQRSDVLEIISKAQDGSGSTYEILQPIFEEVNGMPSCHRCYECDEALLKQVTSKLKKPCDSLLTEDSADSKEQKSKLDHDREWIIGCIKHDGFIKTDRFDKANQIILDALEQTEPSDLISRAKVMNVVQNADDGNIPYEIIKDIIQGLPSVSAAPIQGLPSVSAERVGEWVEKEKHEDEDTHITEWQSARCSLCGKYLTTPFMYYFTDYPYCPSCGAKMKGGNE